MPIQLGLSGPGSCDSAGSSTPLLQYPAGTEEVLSPVGDRPVIGTSIPARLQRSPARPHSTDALPATPGARSRGAGGWNASRPASVAMMKQARSGEMKRPDSLAASAPASVADLGGLEASQATARALEPATRRWSEGDRAALDQDVWVTVDEEDIPVPENMESSTEQWKGDWDARAAVFHMQHRKWFRTARGTRATKQAELTRRAWNHACTLSSGVFAGGVLTYGLLVLLSEEDGISSIQTDARKYIGLIALLVLIPGLIMCVCAFAIIRILLTFKLVMFWCMLTFACLALFPSYLDPILLCSGALICTTIAVWGIKEYLRSNRFMIVGVNHISCVYASAEEAIFEVVPRRFFGCRRKKFRVKIKAVRRVRGMPHGWCEYIDASSQGECLVGYFDHGFPVGPFRSLEPASGNMYESVRVGYCTGRASIVKKEGSLPPVNPTPLSFGVATVESCVTGTFLEDFPVVGVLHGPRPCRHTQRWAGEDDRTLVACPCAKEMEAQMIQIKTHRRADRNAQVMVTAVAGGGALGGLQVDGHVPVDPLLQSRLDTVQISSAVDPESGLNVLRLDNAWQSLAEKEKEALIFIHGFNTTTEGAFKKLGQLLTLGAFPPYIKPWVFSWRAGSILCYPSTRNVSISSEVRSDFAAFLGALRVAGYRGIHIMTHSMGGRVVGAVVQDMFLNLMTLDAPSAPAPKANGHSRGLRLLTLSIINPEITLESFRDVYGELSRYCDHVTVYADQRDSAVKMSQRLFKENALAQSQIRRNRARSGSFNSYSASQVMDIDIVDCTFLDHNLDGAAHSFFEVNRLMVDDLTQVVLERVRAGRRKRLAMVKAGLYAFVTPPSYVKN